MDFFTNAAALFSTIIPAQETMALPVATEGSFDGIDYENGNSQNKACVVA
jgi:hypothetical protein